jgi:hypothetical protein
MKPLNIKLILAALIALNTTVCSLPVQAQDEDVRLATVYAITPEENEIVIASPKAGLLFKMGDLVYVAGNGKNIILSVTFPMQTLPKCQVAKSHQKYFADIQKGMAVYRYVPGNTLNSIQKDLERIDEIRLYNGRIIQGAIIRRGEEYLILTVSGTIKIPECQIKNIKIIR